MNIAKRHAAVTFITGCAAIVALFSRVMFHAAFAQTPQPVRSPEVQDDKRVTFRLSAPNAKEVLLALEGAQRVAMQKDSQGIWSVTTQPLEPDIYGYSFIADGVTLFDPNNPVIKNNLIYTASQVHVPGPATLPWEVNNVSHGVVHRHFYRSGIVGDERDYYVYTPPGYGANSKTVYPVFYLLHGYSDDASAWTWVGRANVILDNLIAQGKARPMVVVMPLGYGAPEIVSRSGAGLRDAATRQRNYDRFRDALLTEVLPEVEKNYKVAQGRESRAIAGLSMGGAESLFVGLNALNRFAWVGAFSSGGLSEDFNATFPRLDAKANTELSLLWIACGTEDRLIDVNRKFREWLNARNIHHTAIETPGAHTWMVWRRNLATFAPLLFRSVRAEPVAMVRSYDELKGNVQKTVAIQGKFSMRGKLGPFVTVSGKPVYLIATPPFSWKKSYSDLEGKLVVVSGTLHFHEAPPVPNVPDSVARPPDYYYFDAESAEVNPVPRM
ncbi:MAG TPA: alpha/beta hydrolase-fold protein [Blastocatellia bacterium]|nr:alpha/beta hydrolase-fold protein [Blastocatellia bacterium]